MTLEVRKYLGFVQVHLMGVGFVYIHPGCQHLCRSNQANRACCVCERIVRCDLCELAA